MIYMLEDDSGIRGFVTYALQNSGFETMDFESPSDFWNAIKHKLPELVLLDIMLPEEDGMSILKKLRSAAETRHLPVIMLSAKGTEYDKATGLDCGADDYIAKPFGTLELISRIRALLRRSNLEQQKNSSGICIGHLKVYPENHEVYADGVRIVLTLKEYELLMTLITNKNRVLSRDALLRKVWGYDFTGESRTVDVHIRTLRSKLGSCGDIIRTVRGVGYKAGED